MLYVVFSSFILRKTRSIKNTPTIRIETEIGLKQRQVCTNYDIQRETSINQTQNCNHEFNKRKIVSVSRDQTEQNDWF